MIATATAPDNTAPTLGGQIITGNTAPAVFLWCATARDRPTSTEDQEADSVRTATTCYMRGLKERVTFLTNSGASWRWRRICFTIRGTLPLEATPVSLETSNGWIRLVKRIESTSTWSNFQAIVFKGGAGVDWLDSYEAPLDTTRIDVKYDRRRVLNSGNQQGKYFDFGHWFPMNKNLVYGDDEFAQSENAASRSTTSKAGMGDYYIMDIIESATGLQADTLGFSPEATLYWHEK